MIDVDNINTTYQYIITTFALNTMLHHVGMLWINENHKKLNYDMEIQNSDLIIFGPWYDTTICKKLDGKLFERFNINARTGRYHIMCSIDEYEKEHQLSISDDGSSSGGCPLPTNSTT